MDSVNSLLWANLSLQMMGLMLLMKKRRKHKRWVSRRWWVRPVNLQRNVLGHFATLIQELKNDEELFFRYTRMSLEVYNQLLIKVSPFLVKNINRTPLSPEQRLLITLKYVVLFIIQLIRIRNNIKIIINYHYFYIFIIILDISLLEMRFFPLLCNIV